MYFMENVNAFSTCVHQQLADVFSLPFFYTEINDFFFFWWLMCKFIYYFPTEKLVRNGSILSSGKNFLMMNATGKMNQTFLLLNLKLKGLIWSNPGAVRNYLTKIRCLIVIQMNWSTIKKNFSSMSKLLNFFQVVSG